MITNYNNLEPRMNCCSRLGDWSEPLFLIGVVLSVGTIIYSFVAGATWESAVYIYFGVASVVAYWRVHILGAAKKIMETAEDLKRENRELKTSVETSKITESKLRSDIHKFQEITKLLDNNVTDIEEVQQKLFNLYERYKMENERQESNNLLTLFGLIDKNQDSVLDREEIKKMKEYIKIVYNKDYDFDKLDRNQDGSISLTEFFEKFRKER